MTIDATSLTTGFIIILSLSVLFTFFLKGTFKDLIILMGIFSIFSFIGGLVDFWLIIIFLILTIVIIVIDTKGGSNHE